MSEEAPNVPKDPLHHNALMEMFEELSFKEKLRKVLHGLKQPRDSGDYKYAKLQILRLSAPVSAVVMPCLVVAMLVVFAKMTPPPAREVEVQIMDPETVDDLEEIEEIIQEPLEPPEPIEMDFKAEVNVPQDTPVPTQQPTAVSPQPAQFDAVAMVKSPVVMRGIFGSRNPGARGAAMKEYGGTGISEGAVIRALRWLKKVQEADGSWTETSGGTVTDKEGKAIKASAKTAMTAFGLLTFLAHGETPSSEDFGPTVEKAIRWLVDNQQPDGSWPRSYQHQIATYAICEAFALTKIPMLRDSASKGIDIIIRGQNPGGGWNYPLTPCPRDDTSVMAWCVQALKAAKMAGLDNPGLEECIKKAVLGFLKNADPKGGFGYSSEGPLMGTLRAMGLTGAGTLSMQFLGESKHAATLAGITYLEERRPTMDWKQSNWREIYYWYYDTQARFHTGGKVWREWNRIFARELVQGQTVLKGEGDDGKDLGYWTTGDDAHGYVMNTTLCALMLQVYYRYLPTFKTPEDAPQQAIESEDDIAVQIKI